MIKHLDDIMNFNLFKGLTVEEVGKFLLDCDYEIKEYNIFDNIAPKEDYIIFLIRGVVKEIYTDYDGNKTDTNIYHYVGENIITLSKNDKFYNLEYTVLVPSVVLFLSRKSLRKFNSKTAKTKNVLYNNILDSFTFKNRKDDVISVFAFQKGVKNKVLKFIEYQKNTPDGMEKFIISKKELADMLKVDYTNLCREIKNLSAKIEDIDSYFSPDNCEFYKKEYLG